MPRTCVWWNTACDWEWEAEGGFSKARNVCLYQIPTPFPSVRLYCPGYRRHLMLLCHILCSPLLLQPMPCWYSKTTLFALALGSALDGLCGSAQTPRRARGMKKGTLCWLARGTTSRAAPGSQILCNQRQLMSKLFTSSSFPLRGQESIPGVTKLIVPQPLMILALCPEVSRALMSTFVSISLSRQI